LLINRKKAEEEERVRKEAEAEAAAQIAELDRQLKVRQTITLRGTPPVTYTPLRFVVSALSSENGNVFKHDLSCLIYMTYDV